MLRNHQPIRLIYLFLGIITISSLVAGSTIVPHRLQAISQCPTESEFDPEVEVMTADESMDDHALAKHLRQVVQQTLYHPSRNPLITPDQIPLEASQGETAPSAELTGIKPERVVVQPWRGRHHVYGFFKVPAGYEPSSFFQVAVDQGQKQYCGHASVVKVVDRKAGSSGDRIVIGRFRTRTTLWLLSQGQRHELNQKDNWTLPIRKQT
ncbi:hypothetical protein ACN4EG_16805 [Alkalinema pantanalense CENA528]|uniref:hypothetical protein n=1 Tax=Alkalinema pantanalense TaxID=1620705 RepID=UPI003D6FDDE7